MAEFRVGDRVRHVQNGTARGGEAGGIRGAVRGRRLDVGWFYAVEFDRPVGGAGRLYYGDKVYLCGFGRGMWCREDFLEPAEVLPDDIKLSFDNMFGGET